MGEVGGPLCLRLNPPFVESPRPLPPIRRERGGDMGKTVYRIRHFSEEDIRQFKEKFPLVPEPLEWALVDTRSEIVMDSYDTQEEVKAVLDEWNATHIIEHGFRDWVRKTAKKVGVEQQMVLDIVQECELEKGGGSMKTGTHLESLF